MSAVPVIALRPVGVADAARTLAVLATGLLAGAVLAVLLVQRPLGSSAGLYVAFRQAVDPIYTAVLAPLGVIGLGAAVVALVTGWSQVRARTLTLLAAGCLALGLAITVLVHFPINAEIATWSAAAPPPDWEQLHERWGLAHALRSSLAVAAFGLLLGARGVR